LWCGDGSTQENPPGTFVCERPGSTGRTDNGRLAVMSSILAAAAARCDQPRPQMSGCCHFSECGGIDRDGLGRFPLVVVSKAIAKQRNSVAIRPGRCGCRLPIRVAAQVGSNSHSTGEPLWSLGTGM